MDFEIESLIKVILGTTLDSERYGTLQLALDRARYLCGNNTDGKEQEEDIQKRKTVIGNIFISLSLYLNCLEQIGNLFYSDEGTKNGITDSLRHACKVGILSVENDEMFEVIRRLRNALSHNYGLVSVPRKKAKENKYYKYIISYGPCDGNRIIDMPKVEWKGNYNDKSDESSVIVYAFSLFKIIEDIIENTKEEFKNGTISCNLSIEEIRSRFTII